MTPVAGIALLTPADSARAISTVYTASLLATLPIILAAIGALALRRAPAEGRALIWRSAIVALLVVYVGRQLPLHWMSWVVPSTFAAPLIALGRIQVTGAATHAAESISSSGAAVGVATLVGLLFVAYLVGVITVLLPTIIGSIRVRRTIGRGRLVNDVGWLRAVHDVRAMLGINRPVRVFVCADVAVPMTWGFLRPIVALPSSANYWNVEHLRIVLTHELSHVRAADWLFKLAARLMCALYWFHPGAWWIARRLREDCELACDDRVIASGVRRTDYAELLVEAADDAWRARMPQVAAVALAERGGLRGRLASVLDTRHDVRPLARGWMGVAAMTTLLVAAPTSAVQLAPTRDVLTTLMRDARWESRAYAVLGLAQRPDSVAVARSAAELDPNPRVRAWARYALGERVDAAELRTLLRDR